jgi:membrane-associated phospholipid phosphatase
MHLTVALTVLLWCYVRRPDVYRAARNALVGINLVGLAVFALYPVAPPRSIRAGFLDCVADVWFIHSKPDHFGALPSFHLAWAVWASVVGLAVVTSVLLRLLLLLHPVITAVVVVATANHYLIDVAAGAVLALASVLVAARWFGCARSAQSRQASRRHRDPLVAAGASAPPS